MQWIIITTDTFELTFIYSWAPYQKEPPKLEKKKKNEKLDVFHQYDLKINN